MAKQHPHIIIIAGPNGAGKSTTAPSLLQGTLGVKEFVNADVIAQGLSAFQPETAAFHAGRIMLERLHYLAKERVRMGGHNVPEEIVRRRYNAGIRNFFQLYQPLTETWYFYDNSVAGIPRLIASNTAEHGTYIENHTIWQQIEEEYNVTRKSQG